MTGIDRPPTVPIYEFGAFAIDTDQRRLLRGSERIALSHKVFDTLELLVAAAGGVVDRETFQSRLWPETVVEERNLTVHISTLRKALADGTGVEYIETVPRVGYRLARPVRLVDAPRDAIGAESSRADLITHPAPSAALGPPTEPAPPFPLLPADATSRSELWHRALRIGFVVGAVSILVSLGAFSVSRRGETGSLVRPAGERPLSIAVMPFRLLGVDQDQEYLGLGLADAVIGQLATLPDLAVRSTSSVAGITAREAVHAGRALDVDYVLEGVVQRQGDVVRVTAQLVDVRAAATRWTDRFEQPFSGLFRLQESVAARVTSSLAARSGAEVAVRRRASATAHPEAYAAQLQGRAHLNRVSGADAVRAIQSFQRAVALSPDYALAWSGLAAAYRQASSNVTGRPLPVNDVVPLAREAAEKALALDGTLGEAHAVLGQLKYQYDWDWAGAEQALARAVELDPLSAEARASYGWFLSALGRHDESISELERAWRLNPAVGIHLELLGNALARAGRPEEALEKYQQAATLNPASGRPHWRRVFLLDKLGRAAEAVRARHDAATAAGNAAYVEALQTIYARDGYRGVIEDNIRSRSARGSWYEVADHYMVLGDPEHAIEALEKCLQQRCTQAPFIRTDSTFATLHGHPRFDALLQMMGLPPVALNTGQRLP